MKKKLTPVIEFGVSLILQIGVTISVATILLGVILLLVQQYSLLGSVPYQTFTAPHDVFAHSLGSLVASVAAGQGLGIIELGVLLLIVTPISRVATSFVLFLHKRDVPMALVTAFVLLVLIGSFYLGIISR